MRQSWSRVKALKYQIQRGGLVQQNWKITSTKPMPDSWTRKHTFPKSSLYQEIVLFVHNRNIWLIIGTSGGITTQNTKRSCLLLEKSSCFTASAAQYVSMGGTGINPLEMLTITAWFVIGLVTKWAKWSIIFMLSMAGMQIVSDIWRRKTQKSKKLKISHGLLLRTKSFKYPVQYLIFCLQRAYEILLHLKVFARINYTHSGF